MLSLNRHINRLSATKRKVILNVYWAVLGYVVRIVSELFVGILVARYLGPEQYGLMSYIISFVTLFSVLATFGLDNIEVRELSRENIAKEVLIGTAFRLKLIFAVITVLLIFAVVQVFEADSFTRSMVLVYSLSIILNSFGVIRNCFTAIVQNKFVVKSEIIRIIAGAGIKVLLLILNAPLIWFIVSVTFDFLILASGYIYSYQSQVGSMRLWKYDGKTAIYLIRQSFPLLLSGAAVLVYQRIDQVMIRNMIDNKSLGYFSTAAKFADLILFLPIVLSQTITPLLVRAKANNAEAYRIRKQQFVGVVVWVTILFSVMTSLFSYWLVYLTFGQQYLASVPVLQVLAFRAVGMALSSSSGQLIIIEDIQKWAYIRNIIGCGVCVIINIWAIPRYGIVGAAWASVITVLAGGFLANFVIPEYREIARIQLSRLLVGWRDLFSVCSNILSNVRDGRT
jgi:O-antigen/teichoic acid export membrane protein